MGENTGTLKGNITQNEVTNTRGKTKTIYTDTNDKTRDGEVEQQVRVEYGWWAAHWQTEGDKHATRGKNTGDTERTQEGMENKTQDRTRHRAMTSGTFLNNTLQHWLNKSKNLSMLIVKLKRFYRLMGHEAVLAVMPIWFSVSLRRTASWYWQCGSVFVSVPLLFLPPTY